MNLITKNGNLCQNIQKKIIQIEKKAEEINKQKKLLREMILKAMEDNDIIKISNDLFDITYVGKTYKETFDSKALKVDDENLYNKYIKISEVSPSLRIKIK